MENGKNLSSLVSVGAVPQSFISFSGIAKKGKVIEQPAVTPCSVQPKDHCFLEVKGEVSPVMANPSWFSPKGPSIQTVKATFRAGYLHLNPNPSLETYVECVPATISADGEREMEAGQCEWWSRLVMILGLVWCHPHVHVCVTSDAGCAHEEIVHLLCYES